MLAVFQTQKRTLSVPQRAHSQRLRVGGGLCSANRMGRRTTSDGKLLVCQFSLIVYYPEAPQLPAYLSVIS